MTERAAVDAAVSSSGAPEPVRAPAPAAGDAPPVVRTVFFGSGEFAVPILDALATTPLVQLVGVISAPDRPVGRRAAVTPVPVVRRARELDLPILQPASVRAPEVVDAIRRLRPGLGVLADYGRIVPHDVLGIPPRGILNLHPSLLPRHRGATPVVGTILAGDPVAGVTLIRMDEGVDTGPIVAAVSWPLDGTETTPEVEARASAEAADLLRLSLPGWLDGSLGAHDQPDVGATLTRPLRRTDGRLDPARPAIRLERQVRAFQPWPGSYLETSAGRLIVWHARAVSGDDAPGHLVAFDGGLALTTAAGLLALDEVQPAGGRRMSGAELVRGRPSLLGTSVSGQEAAAAAPADAGAPR